MKIITGFEIFALEKEGQIIGHCRYQKKERVGTVQAIELSTFEIAPKWRRKGYGSYLCKEFLKRTGGYKTKDESVYLIQLPSDNHVLTPTEHITSVQHTAPDMAETLPDYAQAVLTTFFAKFGFVARGNTLVRHHKPDLTATTFVHQFLAQQLHAPTFCIDATCGNGHDSLFLTNLMGITGHLLALDLQAEAINNTAERLCINGIHSTQYTLVCDNHANLAQHANAESADAILFNFGWLPGADHAVFSEQESSIPALTSALSLLKKGGVLSAILYSGTGIGDEEKNAIVAWMQALPISEYTVMVCQFANWAETAPLPCFIMKK